MNDLIGESCVLRDGGRVYDSNPRYRKTRGWHRWIVTHDNGGLLTIRLCDKQWLGMDYDWCVNELYRTKDQLIFDCEHLVGVFPEVDIEGNRIDWGVKNAN